MTPDTLSTPIAGLAEDWEALSPMERLRNLFARVPAHEILVTTSLGTTSALLLHALQRIAPGHPVYFVDTGYLFPETLHYGTQLVQQLGLNLRRITPEAEDHAFTQRTELYSTQSDRCCTLNKVKPVQGLQRGKTVWISGLLGYQNANRAQLPLIQPKGALSKVYPLLDMTAEEVALYRLLYGLPEHPLVHRGFASLGCTHCTQPGAGREGRWAGSTKTECGLHS